MKMESAINWLEKEEWEQCRKVMDQETFEDFQMLVKSEEIFSVGIPFPAIKIVDVCEDFKTYAKLYKSDFRKIYEQYSHSDYYRELYRILAFTIYGYGNWSNNDRRHKGLPPVRFNQK